jgi:hypothetical protein
MPFRFNRTECLPLVVDNEYEIIDEDLLAEYVGNIILGHYTHVKRIINALSTIPLAPNNTEIDMAIEKLSYKDPVTYPNTNEKRDGWVFQIISWLALFIEENDRNFYCQQPHDAPAQHGLDGIGIKLNDSFEIEKIIITEDKCTENHRVVIPKIWNEFRDFELGTFNNKLVSRISALIETLDGGNVLEANRNNIYVNSLRRYRVGVNRNDNYQDVPKRRNALFKGYETCVEGSEPHRRFGATMYSNDIRGWMETFCQKVIHYLNTQKQNNVQ